MKKVLKSLFVILILLGLIGFVSYKFILPSYATSQCKELYLSEIEKIDQEIDEKIYREAQEEMEQTCNVKNGTQAFYLIMHLGSE